VAFSFIPVPLQKSVLGLIQINIPSEPEHIIHIPFNIAFCIKVNCIVSRTKLGQNEKLIYDESVRGRGSYGKQGGEEIAYVYRALV